MKSFYLLACRLGQSLDASHRDAATFFKSLRGVEQRSTTLTLCGAASGKVQRTGRIRPTGGSPGSGSLAAPPPRDTQLMLHRTMACGWAAGRPGLRPMRCAPCGLAPGFLSPAAFEKVDETFKPLRGLALLLFFRLVAQIQHALGLALEALQALGGHQRHLRLQAQHAL